MPHNHGIATEVWQQFCGSSPLETAVWRYCRLVGVEGRKALTGEEIRGDMQFPHFSI